MAIILLAIIGAKINAGASYWICFGFYCLCQVIKAIEETIQEKCK